MESQLFVFTGIAFLLAITPGADTMLVMRSVLAADWRAGLMTNLGVSAGLLTHAIFSALGLSVILTKSALAFELIKLLGGGYLIFLGAKSVWEAWNEGGSEAIAPQASEGIAPTHPSPRLPKTFRQFFWTGFLTNLLNPKVALFYLAFLPQFVSNPESALQESLLLGGIHLTFAFLWLMLVALLVNQLKQWLTHPKVKQVMETLTGAVLMLLGVRLVAER